MPPGYNKTPAIDSILEKHKAYEDQLIFKGRPNGRLEGLTNWLLNMPVLLAKKLSWERGLTVSFKHCILCPNTHIQRCKFYQGFCCHERRCSSREYCEVCLEKHSSAGCKEAHSCLNSFLHSRRHLTPFDYTHKESVPSCETYRFAYTEERKRLDAIFIAKIPEPPHQPTFLPAS